MSSRIVILLFFLKLASSNTKIQDELIFDGCFDLDGSAEVNKIQDEFHFDGYFDLESSTAEVNTLNFQRTHTDCGLSTAGSEPTAGHVFSRVPLQFKNSTNGSVFSFSTTFIFQIVPEFTQLGSHGLAFAILQSKDVLKEYTRFFNETSANSSHIVAVELDTVQDERIGDINDNHVGIDINNGLISNQSAPAGYYDGRNGSFKGLNLKSAQPIQVWVEYQGLNKQLNVTIHPINISKPDRPLLSLTKDLSPYMCKFMYVGFSSYCGLLSSSHYILGWSFKMNGQAQGIHLSRLPDIADRKDGHTTKQKMMVVVLSLTGCTFLIIFIAGVHLISGRRKFIQVLEEWEVQYGPHRFSYMDLFIATKGFKDSQLLGRGGFGSVYRGLLPLSNIEIAVKKISHNSKQGMREFVAEIATIGHLRHPNLVRLLGYCKRQSELFLIYDYMPNGSLDKFLYRQPSFVLNWIQRFKIIKDVASALFYLHHEWVQVVIHRDIKPANVLIDNQINARLGDFGLAKLCDHGNDPQTSHIAGTPGYIAPELARSGKATTSSDIYAFGVFILEIACGRRPIDPRASPEELFLIDWVMDCWDRGAILETVDCRLGNEYNKHEVELVLKLGLMCSHAVAATRPSMFSIIQFLDGATQLPNNLNTIIKSQDDGSEEAGTSLDVSIKQISLPTMTFTEPFASHGR